MHTFLQSYGAVSTGAATGRSWPRCPEALTRSQPYTNSAHSGRSVSCQGVLNSGHNIFQDRDRGASLPGRLLPFHRLGQAQVGSDLPVSLGSGLSLRSSCDLQVCAATFLPALRSSSKAGAVCTVLTSSCGAKLPILAHYT